MSFDTLRIYSAGRFFDAVLPDWYHEAERLSETEGRDFHRILDRVLACEYTELTEGGNVCGWIEIRFWRSPAHGTFVMIETPLVIVEQVIVPDPTDWLPFLSTHLVPLAAVSTQSAMVEQHRKIANTLIAWARHGTGRHVDRETGLSQIDLNADRDRRRAERARQAMAQGGKGSGA